MIKRISLLAVVAFGMIQLGVMALVLEGSGMGRRSFLQFVAVAGVGLLPAPVMGVEGGGIRYGDDIIMSKKRHGTTDRPVQEDLLYGVSNELADRICSFNRMKSEKRGYFETTNLEEVMRKAPEETPITFYDSVTGKPLFRAPQGRSVDEFLAESHDHRWPSFRDGEVIWENVRVLRQSGETVSVDGTHLGHNLPDKAGNRYCINLVSIAGHPVRGSM
mmetsp:Transcript_9404/g.21648  ORF Transcript_9404/g.21648 Transcript_9404/m.21648 type:complete len:218 (+) Transcript_9404:69-722(+)